MATFGCEAASSLRARTHPTSRLKLQSVDHTIVRGPTSSFVLRLALLLQLLGAVRIDALRASAPSAEESDLVQRVSPASSLAILMHTICYAGGQWHRPTSSFVLRLALLLQLLGAVRIDALRASAPSAEESDLVQRVSPASSLAILMHTICYAGGQWHTNSHHAHGRCVVLRWTHCASKPRAQSCSW